MPSLRIDTMRNTNDGFKISQVDLEIRGPGEVLGTRQTGMLQLRIANIMRDQDLIPKVQETAKLLITEHPQKVDDLIQRWLGKSIELGQVLEIFLDAKCANQYRDDINSTQADQRQ